MPGGIASRLLGRHLLHPFLVIDHLAVVPTLHDEPFHGHHHITLSLEEDDVVLLLIAYTMEIDVVETHHSAVVEIPEQFIHGSHAKACIGIEMKADARIILQELPCGLYHLFQHRIGHRLASDGVDGAPRLALRLHGSDSLLMHDEFIAIVPFHFLKVVGAVAVNVELAAGDAFLFQDGLEQSRVCRFIEWHQVFHLPPDAVGRVLIAEISEALRHPRTSVVVG